ncbi:uncharacterized protein BDW43DRAFT_316936 [Aspergillus alliaceus]|uniref:uncharacterized protein n=1 Tax=Petromyces alliaceus TaxID=209559 RepID=UPI0012A6037C|nr:uncharacterized protein BDW43DRAFT_316936 [Aspergillus alliaceus]KAB8227299.1 hypothetical protein BDW43DRAFT_316936 [Aspergillus alliaceus]
MIIDENRLWPSEPDGRVIISIGFSEHGHHDRRDEVKKVARKWEKACPCIHFKWTRDISECDVRISFKGDLSWSEIGNTAADDLDLEHPTMKLPWVGEKALRRRHILHEFGHMLGAEHEHCSPDFPWDFDKSQVVEHFKREIQTKHPAWSTKKKKDEATARAKRDVLKHLDKRDLIWSSFDDKSIMLYPIKKEWLQYNPYDDIPPEDFDENYELSRKDKKYMRKAYGCTCLDPNPPTPPPIPPPNPVPYPGGFVYGGLPPNWQPIAPPPS